MVEYSGKMEPYAANVLLGSDLNEKVYYLSHFLSYLSFLHFF